jgi:hypothetical protein
MLHGATEKTPVAGEEDALLVVAQLQQVTFVIDQDYGSAGVTQSQARRVGEIGGRLLQWRAFEMRSKLKPCSPSSSSWLP